MSFASLGEAPYLKRLLLIRRTANHTAWAFFAVLGDPIALFALPVHRNLLQIYDQLISCLPAGFNKKTVYFRW